METSAFPRKRLRGWRDPFRTPVTEDEFIRRFVAYMVANAGFAHFGDGTPVHYYAEEIARDYWLDMGLETTPEDAAALDIADWDENEGDDESAL